MFFRGTGIWWRTIRGSRACLCQFHLPMWVALLWSEGWKWVVQGTPGIFSIIFLWMYDLRVVTDVELCPVKASVTMELSEWWVGESISLLLCPRILGFWVGIYEFMCCCGVGNLVWSVQCHKGLVFIWWNQIRKAEIAQERRLGAIWSHDSAIDCLSSYSKIMHIWCPSVIVDHFSN